MEKKRTLFSLVFLGAFLWLLPSLGGAAWAQTTQTITLISGNGSMGSQDPYNQFTLNGGVTWQNAFIINPHYLYSVIPETQYINWDPVYPTPFDTATWYRTLFELPIGFSTPSLTVQVHADNVATLLLNGVQIGQQTFEEILQNFQDPPESFTVTDPSLFHDGLNTLEFKIHNFSGPSGFDYKAIVSFTSVLQVAIDIKPGSFPNSINLSSAGVIPVAILSSATFDATQVNPATVSLAGSRVKLIGKGDKYSCHAEDVNGDGLLDLVCQVATALLFIEPGTSVAVLEAETFNCQKIMGQDSIQIVP